MVHCIGNLMMLGLQFHGQLLITMDVGNHYNLWQKEHFQILQYLRKMMDLLLQLTIIYILLML